MGRSNLNSTTNLPLVVVEFFPLGTEKLADLAWGHPVNTARTAMTRTLTETSIWVFRLDSLSPVLAEEHVGREGALGTALGLGFSALCGLCLALFGGLALWTKQREHCVRGGIIQGAGWAYVVCMGGGQGAVGVHGPLVWLPWASGGQDEREQWIRHVMDT